MMLLGNVLIICMSKFLALGLEFGQASATENIMGNLQWGMDAVIVVIDRTDKARIFFPERKFKIKFPFTNMQLS